LYPTAEIHRKY